MNEAVIYLNENETIYIDHFRGTFSVRSHPTILVAECPTCHGYRFQHYVQGKCYQADSCHYTRVYSDVRKFAEVARRYVGRCAVCNRLYTGRGRDGLCPSPACRRAHAEKVPREETTCAECGAVCIERITVTTSVCPHLHPWRLFVGSEVCLCPGRCRRRYRTEAERALLAQARGLLAEIEAQIAAGKACSSHYEMRVELAEKCSQIAARVCRVGSV